jgi:hypothetical protein
MRGYRIGNVSQPESKLSATAILGSSWLLKIKGDVCEAAWPSNPVSLVTSAIEALSGALIEIGPCTINHDGKWRRSRSSSL